MNKNTKLAHKKGFSSMDDMNRDGHKIFKGVCCDTAWNNPKSNRSSKKQYKKQQPND